MVGLGVYVCGKPWLDAVKWAEIICGNKKPRG